MEVTGLLTFIFMYGTKEIITLRRETVYETYFCEKSTSGTFAKLGPCEKKDFFRISKTYIFTLDSLSINDGHVKNILQDIKQYK